MRKICREFMSAFLVVIFLMGNIFSGCKGRSDYDVLKSLESPLSYGDLMALDNSMSYDDLKKLDEVMTYEALLSLENSIYDEFWEDIDDISIQILYPGEYEDSLLVDGAGLELDVGKITRNLAIGGGAIVLVCVALPMIPGVGPAIGAIGVPLAKTMITEAAIDALIGTALSGVLEYIESGGDTTHVLKASLEGSSEGFMMGALFAPASRLISLKFLKAEKKTGRVVKFLKAEKKTGRVATGIASKSDDLAKYLASPSLRKSLEKLASITDDELLDIIRKAMRGKRLPENLTDADILEQFHNAIKVSKDIVKNGGPLKGYRGGTIFRNKERLLKELDDLGNKIEYWEFDVHKFEKGVNRGKERIVIGRDGSIYFTRDHYGSFIPLVR